MSQNIWKGHIFKNTNNLSGVCDTCGYRLTIVVSASGIYPPCPAFIPTKCECGAYKTGIKAKMAGHSSWCPVK